MRGVFALMGLVIMLVGLSGSAAAAPTWDKDPEGFVHGPMLEIDGVYYYFKGPGSMMGATDVPGHTWVQTGPYQVEGRHYNVGPWFVPMGTPWWATGEPYGVQLYQVHGIVAPTYPDAKTEEKLRKQGYVHRHELVYAMGPMEGMVNEDIRVYLKHIAKREFYFDGGPMMPMYWVYPGVDRMFMPNW
jgi:hypothetical protein